MTSAKEDSPTLVKNEDYGQYRRIIQSGDVVVLTGGDIRRMVTVRPGASSKLCKCVVEYGSLIGQPFNKVYQLNEKTKKLVLTDKNPDLDRTAVNAKEAEVEKKDNRGLEDTHGANQLLDQGALAKVREEVGREGMVQKLVEGSSTFDQKTSFAQEKYVRKKQAKYALLFKVERLTVDSLCDVKVPTSNPDTSTAPDDSRYLPLRVDTVAQMLHYGAVKYNSRVMVYEETNGILPAAIMSRLGTEGRLYNVLRKQCHPQMMYAKNMLLPDVKERWHCVPYEPLLDPSSFESTQFGRVDPSSFESTQFGRAQRYGDGEGGTGKEKPQKVAAEGEDRRSQWIGGKAANELFKENPVDALFVACYDPEPVVRELLPYISLSGTVVAYSPVAEPLYDTFAKIKRNVVDIRIMDTWYREYQVLPGRSHPTVTMSGTGGFVLSGVKVQHIQPVDVEEEPQQEEGGEETAESPTTGSRKQTRPSSTTPPPEDMHEQKKARRE